MCLAGCGTRYSLIWQLFYRGVWNIYQQANEELRAPRDHHRGLADWTRSHSSNRRPPNSSARFTEKRVNGQSLIVEVERRQERVIDHAAGTRLDGHASHAMVPTL